MNILEEEKQRVEKGTKSRVSESVKLIEMICPFVDSLTPKEHGFITNVWNRLEQYGYKAFISEKQLFWLRDIKSKYAE